MQIKGAIEIRTEGPEYERMKERVRRKQADLPARALVILHIQEIHQCLPGTEAGVRLFP